MSGQVKRLMMASVAAAAALTLAGCGGGGSAAPATGAPSVAPAPAEQRAPAVAVAAGLKAIQVIAAQIAAAGTDTVKAKQLSEQIEPQWKQIEDTIKANDKDTYLAFEDAFAVLEGAAEKGDTASATKGSQTVSTTVQGYLAKYPG